MIGKLRGSRHFHRKTAFAPINIAGRRDTINEMIDTNTHDYTREVTARDTDESAMVKVRRNVNMHLKGQGKMQVSNGRIGKKIYISRTIDYACDPVALQILQNRLIMNWRKSIYVSKINFNHAAIISTLIHVLDFFISASDDSFRAKYYFLNILSFIISLI